MRRTEKTSTNIRVHLDAGLNRPEVSCSTTGIPTNSRAAAHGPRRTVYAEVDGGVGIPLLQSPRSRQAKEHQYTCAVSFAFYSSSTKAIAPECGPARSICR